MLCVCVCTMCVHMYALACMTLPNLIASARGETCPSQADLFIYFFKSPPSRTEILPVAAIPLR